MHYTALAAQLRGQAWPQKVLLGRLGGLGRVLRRHLGYETSLRHDLLLVRHRHAEFVENQRWLRLSDRDDAAQGPNAGDQSLERVRGRHLRLRHVLVLENQHTLVRLRRHRPRLEPHQHRPLNLGARVAALPRQRQQARRSQKGLRDHCLVQQEAARLGGISLPTGRPQVSPTGSGHRLGGKRHVASDHRDLQLAA